MNVFSKVLSGIEWFGKEVGKAFASLPRLLKLTEDGEKVASDALPQAIAVLEDAGLVATAAVKDSGKALADLGILVTTLSAAYAAKALNISADKAVVSAFETFCKDFSPANYQDLFNSIEKLIGDTRALDATVIAGLKQLEQDAK